MTVSYDTVYWETFVGKHLRKSLAQSPEPDLLLAQLAKTTTSTNSLYLLTMPDSYITLHLIMASRSKVALSSLPHQATSITCHSCLAIGLSSTTSTGWRGHSPWGGHLARSYTRREGVWHRAAVDVGCPHLIPRL